MAWSEAGRLTRWVLTGIVVVALGVLVGIHLSRLVESPPSETRVAVVKALPPRPDFLPGEAEPEVGVKRGQLPPVTGPQTERQEGVARPQAETPLPVSASAPPASLLPEKAPLSTPSGPPEKPSTAWPQAEKPRVAPAAERRPQPPPSKTEPSKETEEAFAFTLHLESYKSLENLQERIKFLQSLGLDVFSIRVNLPKKGTFHRIFVGKFQDRSQALAFQKRLEKKYGLPRGRIVASSYLDR